MAGKKSTPVVILIILILASLSLAGTVFYLFQKERAKNVALQEKLDEINLKQKITETKLQESKNTVSALELKLQKNQVQIETLAGELEQEKNNKQEALVQLEQLKIDLEQQKGLRLDLEKKLNVAQKDTEKMRAQINNLEVRKADLEKKIRALEGGEAGLEQDVELGKIVVSPEGKVSAETSTQVLGQAPKEKRPALALEGKVLVINKDYNFAVINLGIKDGVEIGNVFSIYHNNKYVGDVKVEKIHESMSAAGFLSAKMRDVVSEGDKVVHKTQ